MDTIPDNLGMVGEKTDKHKFENESQLDKTNKLLLALSIICFSVWYLISNGYWAV